MDISLIIKNITCFNTENNFKIFKYIDRFLIQYKLY